MAPESSLKITDLSQLLWADARGDVERTAVANSSEESPAKGPQQKLADSKDPERMTAVRWQRAPLECAMWLR